MSIEYCEKCGIYVDTDLNAEHFEEHDEETYSGLEPKDL